MLSPICVLMDGGLDAPEGVAVTGGAVGLVCAGINERWDWGVNERRDSEGAENEEEEER